MKEEIVIDNIEELKNFLDTIDSKTKRLYIKAIETNDINLISDFSNSVLEIATKYNIKYMIDYSELLLEKINAFEIDSIAILLGEYDDRIKDLRSRV